MGCEDDDSIPGDAEGPVREVLLDAFSIDITCVTNLAFSAFVEATGYRTDSERLGWSFVFRGLVPAPAHSHILEAAMPHAPWWVAVKGACWQQPFGPGSRGEPDHPVVQVSWYDAQAFAAWAGRRLPTETEWEKAARGGLSQCRYPWGDSLHPDGAHHANIWQGEFPERNTAEDGYVATAPVGSFPPNGYGVYEMAGNVWEWCSDWWSASWHEREHTTTRVNPQGPPDGGTKVMRGGSYLCHASYCNRYRVAARTHNAPGTSTCHTGFRCAGTIPTAT